MIRGTTPTHTFTLPFEVSVIKSLVIIYAQNDIEVLRKEKNDCTLDGNTIVTKLTQEESLKFNHSMPVQIQLKILTAGNDALASYIHTVPVLKCLTDEVLA